MGLRRGIFAFRGGFPLPGGTSTFVYNVYTQGGISPQYHHPHQEFLNNMQRQPFRGPHLVVAAVGSHREAGLRAHAGWRVGGLMIGCVQASGYYQIEGSWLQLWYCRNLN